MATLIRPEVSLKNKYYIDKHRHYELKHFCLQYPNWKKHRDLIGGSITSSFVNEPSSNTPGDPTAKRAMIRVEYARKIEMIEHIAKEADRYLHEYILKAVTEGLSYTYLRSRMGIPCGRDLYYDRYRKFFWLLSNARD